MCWFGNCSCCVLVLFSIFGLFDERILLNLLYFYNMKIEYFVISYQTSFFVSVRLLIENTHLLVVSVMMQVK